ncbi:MAG: 4-(cytidine 5'-diphospho)-2-C-methyl-D-erythritol kinase [Clostridiales bacterium]|nr:4-(cytidine 5'-diphospho)-2-C-methyl-D-erythritol kinase [Clostridiales bacterium]MCF8021561.1 4-(cytidine 5'-diphospho)-2-C-methyl-D-erythritol kinase [Clostridiales bacterium]
MLTINAHAKINLTLDVTGILPDGYHELNTIMQSLELHDTLIISSSVANEIDNGISLSTDSSEISTGRENLVYKAARCLQEYASVSRPVHIHINKRIPVSAGLGGGSADAAAALIALNKFWETNIEWTDLLKLASNIGADVPFCMQGSTALAKGKGEQLEPLNPCPEFGVVLVKPDFGVSTAMVYNYYDKYSNLNTYYTGNVIEALICQDPNQVSSSIGNVLEIVTADMYREIKDIKQELKEAGALNSEMTGSGPTVFGLTGNIQEARGLTTRLRKGNRQVIVTCIGTFYPSLQRIPDKY